VASRPVWGVGKVLAWLAVILGVSALAVVLILHFLMPRYVPPVSDWDYDPIPLNMCYRPIGAPAPKAPFPPASSAPVGQAADTSTMRFRVPQPALLEKSLHGKPAKGVFVIVSVEIQYIGDIPVGLGSSDSAFQFVDNTGTVNCDLQNRTASLSPAPATPSPYPYSTYWPGSMQVLPNQPPVSFTLVFDVNPAVARGAYLRVWDWARGDSTNLTIGI